MWSLSTETRRNLVKRQIRNKKMTNVSAVLAVKQVPMVTKVVWVRRRRRVLSLKRRKRRKLSRSRTTRPKYNRDRASWRVETQRLSRSEKTSSQGNTFMSTS